MKLNKHEVKFNLHFTTVKVFKDSQLKIPQSDYINLKNYGEKTLISGLIVRTRPDRS